MPRDLTRMMLEAAVNEAVNKLKKIPRGDPAHIRAAARVIKARKELDDYLKEKKK